MTIVTGSSSSPANRHLAGFLLLLLEFINSLAKDKKQLTKYFLQQVFCQRRGKTLVPGLNKAFYGVNLTHPFVYVLNVYKIDSFSAAFHRDFILHTVRKNGPCIFENVLAVFVTFPGMGCTLMPHLREATRVTGSDECAPNRL